MSHDSETAYDIDTLRHAIRAASQAFRDSGELGTRTKPDGSLVTDVDLAVQQAVLDVLGDRHGDDLVVAEESGCGGQSRLLDGHARRWWGVDPIDGTANFVSRLPVYCVSIGLCAGRKPIAGAIWDPSRDRLHGSWQVDTDPWPVASTLADLRIGVEFEGPDEVPARAAAVIHELVPKAAMTRVVGSAALGLAWVSMGWLDAFFHPQLAPWDYAAGFALIEAAGGMVASPHVGAYSSWVLAGSPSAFAIMSSHIRRMLSS